MHGLPSFMDFMEQCRSVGKYRAGTFIISAKIIWDFRFLYTKWSDFAAVHGANRPTTNPAVWLKINSAGRLLRFMDVSLGSLIHRHYHQQVTLYLLLLWPLVLPRTHNFISFSYWNLLPCVWTRISPTGFLEMKWISPERGWKFSFLKEL